MDSWVLEGDSYSFLRSAPRNFNLQHLDGPNRVEIFDITSIPSHRSAISETTCLCDIFGDDSESPSLSSSPASASFLKKDTDEQLPVEDVNDSSGSYHTANGSEHLSDGSEIYEDSKDTKDLFSSETLESNVQGSDLPVAACESDAPAPIRNWQESDLSQDTSLAQVENSSDHQLATSTSEFRDTNIRVTGSSQEIFSPELLSENKTITDQSHATSFELRKTYSSEEIITHNHRHITKQRDAFSSEQNKKDSAENIITPDSSLENGSIIEQRDTTTSEVREPDTAQENKHYKQCIFSENQTSSESYPSNLTSEDSTKGNNDPGCLTEEGEKISLPDILSIENSLLVCGTVQGDSSVALTNFSNDGSVFTSLQNAGVSDPSAQDDMHDLTDMSAPLEHEDVPNELAHAGAFQCDDEAGMSDLPDSNDEPLPDYIRDNTEVDVGYMPQDFNISSDTTRTLSSFSDPREELVSNVISEVCTPSGSSVDVNFPELPIIIHSPVGFTICPSPEPENKGWSEDLALIPRTPESDYRLTPTDKGSVSSFDSNLCPTPEPRSISSTSDNRQDVFICDPSPAASSLELRSASCSPEIQITPCSFLPSQNDFSSPDEVLEQPHDLDGIIHAEMSTTIPTKEAADLSIPIIYNLSSAQEDTSCPSTILPRDTVFPGVKERCIESPTLNILPTNEITNISSNLPIGPHSTLTTEPPDVHKGSVESCISTISSANETIPPDSSLSPSTEGGITRSPSMLSIPRDTPSPDIVGTGFPESFVSTTSPTKDIEMREFSSPTLQPLLTEGGISRPPSNVCTPIDTASPDVDGLICEKSAASTTLLTNETTIMAILPHSPTASNVSIRKDTVHPDVEETIYPQTPMSTMLPIKEITPIQHISSKEGGTSRSVPTLSIPEDTVSPDVAGRCEESFMPTIMPTNETTNMSSSLISNSSSTVNGISRPSSSLNIPMQCNTASDDMDGLGYVEIPTSATVLTDEITNAANSPIDPSLTEDISRPPSNLIIPGDTMCLDAEVTKYPEGSNEISVNKMTNMAISPIFDHSTDGETSSPASTSIDVDPLRCVECPTSSILPPNEAPNMGISPVFNISSNISPTEGCLCNPPLTLGIPKDSMFPEIEGRRNPEKLIEIPINEATNMNISPLISNLSSTERELSRPPSTSSISRNTSSSDVEALRYIESPTSTILPTNKAPNMGISPVFNISSTVGGSSTSPPSLSLTRDTMSSDIKERRHTETLIEMPTNETTNLPNSPIISNLSSTEKEISRPQSTSSISRNNSTDVDALRPTPTSIDVDISKCVGSATSIILPTNQAPNMGISSFFNISSTVEGSSTPSSALCLPGDAMSFDVEGRTSHRITSLASSTMLPTNIAIASSDNFSSTVGGTVPRQSSNLGLPSDSTSPGVEGTRYVERSNEVPTHDNKNLASSISSLTTPAITLTDIASCSKMRYQRTPDRFNDHIPTPEYTHHHLSASVNEKVDLQSMVPVDRGQIDDTGSKMSLSLPQDDCKDNTLLHCSQTEKISEMSPEPPAPKLSVKQIKESWERMNESILNSLRPWQTSKKKAKEAKERNDIGREMLERESAGSEKTFRQMGVRPGESPSVLHSSDHTMYEGQSCRNKGWSGERVLQEECTLGRGVGNIAEGSHRGEQVELSFSTRNRKGPAHHSPTPSSRDPKSGIPPRYFESPLATRRQQSLLRAQNIQKENKTGARRVRSTSQSNPSAAGRLFPECTSETSSMGSEFDDSDCEVKWLTDQAFRSLSSPRVDYLDVYNSSRGSSTNVSQPSTTMDSPGSATWITYADLHDSLHENNDVLCHPSPFLQHDTLDPAKRFEMNSFECVDVALESKEETRRGKRTVPKRQIQFKKRNDDELKSTENEGSDMDLLSTETCLMNTFVRQHSTPASVQEDLLQGESEIQTGKKMLQKSASLDESLPKSKMASSVIKSVLSKKMDAVPKEPSRTEPCENKNEHVKTLTSGDACNLETQRCSLPSVCSLPSEDFAGKEERSPYTQKRIRGPKVPPKPAFKPTFLPPNNIPVNAVFQDKNLMRDQITPIKVDTLESKLSKKQSFGSSEKEASKVGDKYNSDAGSGSNQTTNCTAICVASTQRRMITGDNKHPMTPETCKQLEGSSSMFLSKTPEITLKPCTIKDKNKSSLKASVCPDLEISTDAICEPVLELKETAEEQNRFKTGEETDTEEDTENNKAKSVIHKVRDVRKLVKNTYNLSFKASNNTHLEEDALPEKQKEMQPEHPHSLQIECKAISLKDKSASSNKSTLQQDAGPFADTAKIPQTDSLTRKDGGITQTFMPNSQHSDVDLFVGLDKSNNIVEQGTNLEMPSRPSSKEVSTLVFLQDGAPKSVQKPPSPASTDVKTANSSHSVSMLRKEKGMQADIGVCDVLSEGTGSKPKHINRLEVPLQTYASEGNSGESRKVKKEGADLPPEQKTSLNSGFQSSGGTLPVRSSPKPNEMRALPNGKGRVNQSQQASKEQDISVVASNKAEVRAFSSSTKMHAMPVTTSKEIELPIQVRSISSDRAKPSVLPKPSYKQPFAEIRSTSTDLPKSDNTPTASILKEQTHLKSDVKVNDVKTSTAVKRNEQTTNPASSNIKTLAVSAVSSHKSQTIPDTTSSAQKSTATSSKQEVSITSIQNKQQQNIQEQVMVETSCASNYQTLPAAYQANTYIQPEITTSSNKQLHKNDFHFPTTDDPPSYDERESFSPLQLSDLPSRRQNRHHPTTKHSLCSCTACTNPQFGQPYHASQNQTPPVPRSPSQVTSYTGAPPQAQVRPHQCKTDGQPSTYPSLSPKTTVQQTPAMIQPIHHSHICPAPAIQPYGNEQQQPSTQHMDRRSGNQRSPQAQSGATYREHSRSPNVACLDPRSQFFNPQELPPAFGHEYGGDSSGNGAMLYPENASGLGYGQGRRVLLDPETGKYFYIEVPMQPLRKMLFDPEIGQYVEVLIPQQALSNSSMYPPTAAPYQSPYHGQGLYTSQYLPYAMPPHTQSAQQPRNPEPSVPTSLHQNTMGYGSSASQAPKSEVKGHPSLDQGYLESMYYIPTGMNASPNSTPSDCYHKPATNMPAATGGRRA